MRIARIGPALAVAVALSGCASPPPTGPNVLAVPGPNKTLAQFQLDDTSCRTYAQTRIGETSPSGAAATGSGGSTAAGKAVVGGAAGQRAYDISYIQCMVASGDKLQSYATYAEAAPGSYAYLPYPYAYPYLGYGYGYPGFFGGPVIAFGFGGGWGRWGGWHGGWGGGHYGGRRWYH